MQIITHADCLRHQVHAGHPERPERLSHLLAHLDACGLSQDHPLIEARPASAQAVLRAHQSPYLAWLETQLPVKGLVNLDQDTAIGPHSFSAALRAAGAVCQGVEAALSGSERRSFCAVRPPGHHAESDAAMGFCMLNSIAIGALHALAQADIERVAILDFDVHHGNGTVEILRDKPEVLVCSSFQHPFYPHRFFNNDWANIVNTPLPAGSDGNAFRAAIEQQWLPAIEAHQPQLILVSAGFDGHRDDPLAGLNLTEDDFSWVTELTVSLADQYAEGRIISTLEGGYDLTALGDSVVAHLSALR